jgi:hypothetical protein
VNVTGLTLVTANGELAEFQFCNRFKSLKIPNLKMMKELAEVQF